MKPYTNEDARNAVIATLAQGKPCLDERDNCVYDAEIDGVMNHCVIGHMIKDNNEIKSFIKDLERELRPSDVTNLVRRHELFDVQDLLLLRRLQEVHDVGQTLSADNWLNMFNDVLEGHKLLPITQEEVDNFTQKQGK